MTTPGSKRRPLQVYVEIPPSFLDLSRYESWSSHRINRLRLEGASTKENILALSRDDGTSAVGASLKRKASLGTDNLSAKKSKQEHAGRVLKDEGCLNGTDSSCYPNGFIYCHQCLKKRDKMASIQCTTISHLSPSSEANSKGRRCTAKFCKSCLKNRYGEDINQIKNDSCHAEGFGYIFKCPKCRDICNCARCRKVKGLEPTGNLTNIARKAGASSAAQMLSENPTIEGIMPGKGKQVENKPTTASNRRPVKYKDVSKTSSTMIHSPIWKQLHILLDPSAVEDRIYIREFMSRFGRIMDPTINKSHMEELEFIGDGGGRDEFEDMPSWVSESCVKSMILGLLGLLITECHNPEAIKSSIKEIKSMGANLNKIWNVLQSLRTVTQRTAGSSTRHEPMYIVFPDPLPPPASATIPQTRSARNAGDAQHNIRIICSGQMIPVLTALIDVATATNAIREEIETGLKEAKEITRRIKESIRLENERWEISRKAMLDKENSRASGQYKLLRDIHKQRLLSIENANEVISSYYAVRFNGFLGKDDKGRAYWTLCPGVEESTAAHDFLTAMSCERPPEGLGSRKTKKDPLGPKAQLRGYFREWPYFIAVWGKAPESKQKVINGGDLDNEDTGEKWWAFDDAGEIRKLATWLNGRDEDGDSKDNNDALSKRLIQFADLMEWRGRVNRYALPN